MGLGYYAARHGPLRGKAGEPGRIGRPHLSRAATPSATLHRLSESGRITHAHRRLVGQFVSTARERSRGGPISRSGQVRMSTRPVAVGVCTRAQVTIVPL
jgi:hypothetical protein